MQLLDSYLQAVKLYLPRANSDDIIRELSANLLSQMEERESALGRPLSEDEQMALLKQHGDPMLVARRYRQDRPSLSIGVELIGPELFPMYLIILGLNLSICIIFTALFFLAMKLPLSIEPFVFPVLLQIVCVTTIFIILNLIRRKYPQPWYYPPAAMAPLIPIARWTSISGLVVWLIFTSWWAATPYFPQLVLGSAAKGLELAPVIVALSEWGDRWAAPDGRPILYTHAACGGEISLQMTCATCGRVHDPSEVRVRPGPGMPADRAALMTSVPGTP